MELHSIILSPIDKFCFSVLFGEHQNANKQNTTTLSEHKGYLVLGGKKNKTVKFRRELRKAIET